jgi:benzoate membrane transport protein
MYAFTALLSLLITLIYRQPLVLTGNIFIIIFITRLGARFSYPELLGASVLAGAIVLLVSILGLTERLAKWIPVPVVFALLAAAVLPFVVDIFTRMAENPTIVVSTVVAYFISRALLGKRVPAIFTALVVGLTVTGLTGRFEADQMHLSLIVPAFTIPRFRLASILTATPIFVILITLQSNMPSLRYLQSQGYEPRGSLIDVISGIGTMLSAPLGPIGVSLSLPVTSLLGGPGAGPREIRYRASAVAATAVVVVGLLGPIVAQLTSAVPLALLRTLMGLALLNVLAGALRRLSQGPLVLGPLLTFAVALSEVTFFGLGPNFWAIVVGTGISWLLERDKLRGEGDRQETAGRG